MIALMLREPATVVGELPHIAAARELAWWPHTNLHGLNYWARKEAADRLSNVLPGAVARSAEEAAILTTARTLAACSFANRWGVRYYERKDAFARLRGALFVYDERRAGR